MLGLSSLPLMSARANSSAPLCRTAILYSSCPSLAFVLQRIVLRSAPSLGKVARSNRPSERLFSGRSLSWSGVILGPTLNSSLDSHYALVSYRRQGQQDQQSGQNKNGNNNKKNKRNSNSPSTSPARGARLQGKTSNFICGRAFRFKAAST